MSISVASRDFCGGKRRHNSASRENGAAVTETETTSQNKQSIAKGDLTKLISKKKFTIQEKPIREVLRVKKLFDAKFCPT